MVLKANKKFIDLSNIKHLLTNGEKNADFLTFEISKNYNSVDLSDCIFILRAVNSNENLIEQTLKKQIENDSIFLTWVVDEYFTAISGVLKLEIRGIKSDELVIKYDLSDIYVRESAVGEGIPEIPETTVIQGEKGDKGDTGADGLSAYEIWLKQGNSGTESDFLESLKGDKGEQGLQGQKGDTGEQGLQGIQGENGKDGLNGQNGESAYEIWLDLGNIGTESDFLQSLKGEKGDTGEQGLQGIQGEKGDTGERGLQGVQGEKGDTGQDGADGKNGKDGTDGQDGKNGFSPIVEVLGIQPETAEIGCFLRITYFDDQQQKVITVLTENLKANSDTSCTSVIKETLLNTLNFSSSEETLQNYGNSVYIYESSAENFQTLSEIVDKWGGLDSSNNFVSKANSNFGINLSNWSEMNVSTGILFTHKLKLFTGRLLFSIYANFSNWTNQILNFHLIQAETLEQAISKALAGEYAQSMDYTLAGSLAQTDDIFAFGSVSAGNYYLYIDGTAKGDNSNFTYAKIEYLNY